MYTESAIESDNEHISVVKSSRTLPVDEDGKTFNLNFLTNLHIKFIINLNWFKDSRHTGYYWINKLIYIYIIIIKNDKIKNATI